jgi:hypothetical protein
MREFKLFNNIFGWAVFTIAAVVYLLTIEPTASFWDCGEFISTAYKLEVGHPPGAPFFMLTARFFTLFASDPSFVAMMVNAFSAVCSAFCILLLFWTITHLARKLLIGDGKEFSNGQIIAIIGSGLVGALIYTFSDTFWFSAVEGEVYAYSSLFTALAFWAILKWEDVADEPYANRWLVLIAYLMGLSIGVHLLNLLAIPALVLVYYFKKYDATVKGTIISLIISFCILAVLLFGLVPGFVEVAGWFELFFVNTLGAGFNTGTLFYALLLTGCLVWCILETYKTPVEVKTGKKTVVKETNRTRMNVAFILSITLLGIPFFGGKVFLGIVIILALAIFLFWKKQLVNIATLNTIIICFTVILIGYSSYATIVIRSAANPPMDQNSPDDVFALKSYLNRDQYGAPPLFYGESYASEIKYKREGAGRYMLDVEEGDPVWAKKVKASPNEKDEYVIVDYKRKYNYASSTTMFFPRLHSRQESHIAAYKEWANIKGREVEFDRGVGMRETTTVPTFMENLRFFFSYQVNFMYWRYFMWNFVGRQNDIQGHGEVTHGNWVSGIGFIDKWLVGDQTYLPDELKDNKGHNTYYFLPLLLGILGIVYQYMRGKRGKEGFAITFVLFFMTGLAILLYLNQTPFQPRERDYAYAGSFYAFSIWIGLGVLAVSKLISFAIKNKKLSALMATAICLPVPILMADQNWDDHDRSGRTIARDFGQNYLMSIEPNAIIFTYGDNDTFPLWYNQEVEGFRTDTRVTNLSYFQMDWYADQMKRQAYESEPLPISFHPSQYSNGKLQWVTLKEDPALWPVERPMNAKVAMDYLKQQIDRGNTGNNNDLSLPAKKFYLAVDKDAAVNTGTVKPENVNKIVSEVHMDLSKKRNLGMNDIMIMDMLQTNNWERPIYYAISVGSDNYLGLDDYFQLEGFAYRIVPVKQPNNVNTEVLYDNLMHRFKWGGIENPKVYLDENARRMPYTARSLFIQLSDALMREGKRDSAISVLDHSLKVIPLETLPHNFYSLSMANLYYQLGEKEKGNVLLDGILENSLQYLKWLSSLSPGKLRSASSDFRRYFSILREVIQIAGFYGYEELVEENEPLIEKYATEILSKL